MSIEAHSQYGTPCVWPEDGQTAQELIAECLRVGAVYREDGPDDIAYVVALRPDVGAELWSEHALIYSLKRKHVNGP
jgi:hypothetical protein